jgi:phosphonate ABC transporter permease subunit PhnE
MTSRTEMVQAEQQRVAASALEEQKQRPSTKHLLRLIGIALAVFLVYAFAVQVTQINLEKPLDPGRQESLVRVLRLLADPDIFATNPDTGNLTLSDTTRVTISRIIETILMALLASTAGTLLAMPVSFIAARNLMEPITAPLASIMGAIVSFTIAGFVGLRATSLLGGAADSLSREPLVGLAVLLGTGLLVWLLRRLGGPMAIEDDVPTRTRVIFVARLILLLALLVFGLVVAAELGMVAGNWLEDNLGPFAFLGNALYVVSDMVRLILPAVVALVVGVVGMSFGSRFAQEAVISWPGAAARALTAVLAFLGTAVVIFGIGSFLNWLYQFDNPQNWTTIPALIGGAIVAIVGLIMRPSRPLIIGFIIYTITRGILNILRSIEPLIMGIVFVVWVSLGPFAGIMALTLHSIAALGKLFSEQVEGISEGPVEAITATGANHLQMVVYAVIPQIIPPFTAFALYRWDINVRMSTIIGFVGGGGIGFVLSQNIQLLRYRQASVMMLAIAIVVAALDFASSQIRRRII